MNIGPFVSHRQPQLHHSAVGMLSLQLSRPTLCVAPLPCPLPDVDTVHMSTARKQPPVSKVPATTPLHQPARSQRWHVRQALTIVRHTMRREELPSHRSRITLLSAKVVESRSQDHTFPYELTAILQALQFGCLVLLLFFL